MNRANVESYRKGGSPLRDTGALMNSLNAKSERSGDGLRLTLRSPLPHAAYHQNGFSTSGPNFIPLTRKASRFKTTKAAIAAGLRKGFDFIFARNGVTVPQRKIYNMAPENRAEIMGQIRAVLKG